MVVGGINSHSNATYSVAIGTNVRISNSASNAVAVSAYTSSSKSCATTVPGSLTLCAERNVTIQGSALVVNGVDVLRTTSDLKAELLNTKGELADLKAKTTSELADLKAKVVALTALKTQTQTSPASVSLVGTLLALSLTAAAVA
jgi:hypothetical protein